MLTIINSMTNPLDYKEFQQKVFPEYVDFNTFKEMVKDKGVAFKTTHTSVPFHDKPVLEQRPCGGCGGGRVR